MPGVPKVLGSIAAPEREREGGERRETHREKAETEKHRETKTQRERDLQMD